MKVVYIGPIIELSMNEEPTKDLPDRLSFEDRIFARFDAVDARFDTVDERFDTVDERLEKLEARSLDTKPIWERALKEIMEIGTEMGEVKSKVALIETEVAGIKTDYAGMKTEVASMKTDYAGIRNDLTDMKRDIKYQVNKRLDLILEFLVEGRVDLRDAEERIKQLETKLA